MFDKFNDECAIFGIAGHSEAANLAYLGLYAMQHRGQESAGIAAADGTRVVVSKEMGYVADIFNSARLATLTGESAIGHTRYSTAGESGLTNAQPILIDCAHGQIAIAHNGNLVNAQELRDHLVRMGSIFQTSSDTEVILHLYARSRAGTIEDAIVESVQQVRGAFSLVILTKDKMIAVRDPHGFRPLALGKLGDSWVACSETCALDLIGAQVGRATPGVTQLPERERTEPVWVADRDDVILREDRERKGAANLCHGIDQRFFDRRRLGAGIEMEHHFGVAQLWKSIRRAPGRREALGRLRGCRCARRRSGRGRNRWEWVAHC